MSNKKFVLILYSTFMPEGWDEDLGGVFESFSDAEDCAKKEISDDDRWDDYTITEVFYDKP